MRKEDKAVSQYVFGDRARKPILILSAFIVGVFIAGQLAGEMGLSNQTSAVVDPALASEMDRFNTADSRSNASMEVNKTHNAR